MKFKRIRIFFKRNILWILIFFCSIGFLAFAENVFDKEIMDADIIGYNILSEYFISDAVTPFAKFITNFGGIFVIVFFTVLLLLFLKNRKQKILIPINMVLVIGLNQALKFILQRPRPIEYRIIDEIGYSFPSGHSMLSLAFYGYLIYLTHLNIKNKYLKWFIIVLLSVLIGLIGISRIYLGVHYTSDVLAGYLIAFVYLIVFVKCTEKLRIKGDKLMKNSILSSFKHAFEGVFAALKTERNMKIHTVIMCIVIILGIYLDISKTEWITCIVLFVMVMAGELFNTAIEAAVDLAMPHQHSLAKKAKDVSAGAVLLLAIGAAVVGLMIFVPKIWILIS